MLIHINKRTAISYSSVSVISYDKDLDVTKFKSGKDWFTSTGDWRHRIEAALQVRAVAVYKTHHVLRS